MSTRFKIEVQYVIGGGKRSKWYDITNRITNRPRINYRYEGTIWSYGVAVVSIMPLRCENADGLLSPKGDYRSVFNEDLSGANRALMRVIYPTDAYEPEELNPNTRGKEFVSDGQRPVFIGFVTTKVSADRRSESVSVLETRSFESVAKDIRFVLEEGDPDVTTGVHSADSVIRLLLEKLRRNINSRSGLNIGVRYDVDDRVSWQTTYNSKLFTADATLDVILNKLLRVENSVFYYNYNTNTLTVHNRGATKDSTTAFLREYIKINGISDGSERVINDLRLSYTPVARQDVDVVLNYNPFGYITNVTGLTGVTRFQNYIGYPQSSNVPQTQRYVIRTGPEYNKDSEPRPTSIIVDNEEYPIERIIDRGSYVEWQGYNNIANGKVEPSSVMHDRTRRPTESYKLNVLMSNGSHIAQQDDTDPQAEPNPETATEVKADPDSINLYGLKRVDVDATFLNFVDYQRRISEGFETITPLVERLKRSTTRMSVTTDTDFEGLREYQWNLSGRVYVDLEHREPSLSHYTAARSIYPQVESRLSVFDPRVIVDGSAVLYKLSTSLFSGNAQRVIDIVHATREPAVIDTTGMWATEIVSPDRKRYYIGQLRIVKALPEYRVIIRLLDHPVTTDRFPGIGRGQDFTPYYVTNLRWCFRYRGIQEMFTMGGIEPYNIFTSTQAGRDLFNMFFADRVAGRVFPMDIAVINSADSGIDGFNRIIPHGRERQFPVAYRGTNREVRSG